jgi:hypothetical protein
LKCRSNVWASAAGHNSEPIRQPRDRLTGQPQERQHSAAEGGTRDRLPPARGVSEPARLHLAPLRLFDAIVGGPRVLWKVFMLHFDSAWRFDSPGPAPNGAVADFLGLIARIVPQGNRKQLLEYFKGYFAGAAGRAHYTSSNESWAQSDLEHIMDEAAGNAPLFIEAFYNACEDLRARRPEMVLPDVTHLNRILNEHEAGYQIQPPNLVATKAHITIPVPARAPSLDTQAQEIIQTSLQASERLLAEGHYRQAVQEILWLLETVSTAFRGLSVEKSSIEGRYFNKIIGELKAKNRGRSVEHVLSWMTSLHGYLSSPTGGGIRHGVDLKDGLAIEPSEAT